MDLASDSFAARLPQQPLRGPQDHGRTIWGISSGYGRDTWRACCYPKRGDSLKECLISIEGIPNSVSSSGMQRTNQTRLSPLLFLLKYLQHHRYVRNPSPSEAIPQFCELLGYAGRPCQQPLRQSPLHQAVRYHAIGSNWAIREIHRRRHARSSRQRYGHGDPTHTRTITMVCQPGLLDMS